MMKHFLFTLLSLLGLFLISCSEDVEEVSLDDVVVTSEVITESYIGNGFQWDAYPQVYRGLGLTVSDADWEKMYQRLDYMRPSFMRVVYGSFDKYASGGADNYEPENFLDPLKRILQYCQDNDITVMAGDWGFNQVDLNQNRMIVNRVQNAARYLDFLIEDQGFTCIKYYNTVNEPNLIGSATNGNYDLWRFMTSRFVQEFEALGNSNNVTIAGPDIAYFSSGDLDWISNSSRHLGDEIGLYDVHTYPPREQMFNGVYELTLENMIKRVPSGVQTVLGEFGYKYETGNSNKDVELDNVNKQRINSDPNIADDSNTLVEEFFHGVDMMGMVMKIINAGYAGAVNWNLDDAMHTGDPQASDFKVWGLWNIMGEEVLGDASKEIMRPHFYAYSLLTRYMQSGSRVFKVVTPEAIGLDAISVEKDGMRMLAFNNMYSEDHTLNLKFEDAQNLEGMKKFVYKEFDRIVDDQGYPLPEEENVSLNASGNSIVIPAQTFVVYTNFNY